MHAIAAARYSSFPARQAMREYDSELLNTRLAPTASIAFDRHALVLPRTAATAQLAGAVPFVAAPCSALLLRRGERVQLTALADAEFVADIVFLPDHCAQRLDNAVGRHRDLCYARPMLPPLLGVSAEQYLQLRMSVAGRHGQPTTSSALSGWVQWLAGSAMVDAASPRLAQRASAPSGGMPRFALAQSLAARLNADWSRNEGLEALAGEFAMSPFHLIRAFRQIKGYTPHQYLIQIRLRRALDLIGRHGCRIIEVAEAAGFCSHAHFSNAFRNVFGVTPRSVGNALAAVEAGERGKVTRTMPATHAQQAW